MTNLKIVIETTNLIILKTYNNILKIWTLGPFIYKSYINIHTYIDSYIDQIHKLIELVSNITVNT